MADAIDEHRPAVPLAYAPARPADAVGRKLHRLSVLNAICGPLACLQLPGCFVAAYVAVRRFGPPPRRPVSADDLIGLLGPHPERVLPSVIWYVGMGLTGIASAVLIARRRGRWFCTVAGFSMCFAVPFGTVAGLTTAIVLMRRTTADAYAAERQARLT